jgi:hypothetical protein
MLTEYPRAMILRRVSGGLLWPVCWLALSVAGCGDGEGPAPASSELTGRVFRSDDALALPNAKVRLGQRDASSDRDGRFSIKASSSDKQRNTVEVQAEDVAPVSKSAPAGKAYLEVFAKKLDARTAIEADKDAELASGEKKVKVTLKANSLSTEDGSVWTKGELVVAVPEPTKSQELSALPGEFDARSGDKRGKLAIGAAVYVGAQAEGKQLVVREGAKAGLSFAVNSKQKSTQVTLYRYEDAQSSWLEQGALETKQDAEGNEVVEVEIERFGWYATGTFLGELSCVRACAVGPDQKPASFARATATGVDLATQNASYAGSDGCFVIDVPARSRLSLSVLAAGGSSKVLLLDSPESGRASEPDSCEMLPAIVVGQAASEECPGGFAGCAGRCVDVDDYLAHCENCDRACEPEQCAAAACQASMGGLPGLSDAGGLDAGQLPSDAAAADGAAEPVLEPADFYVDSARGQSGNPGTLEQPFRSITEALQGLGAVDAGSPVRVQVLPGLYDGTVEAAFPITVPSHVVLVGDEASRGQAGIGTVISGKGVHNGVTTTLLALPNARLSGFRIVPGSATFDMGVLVESQNPTISFNTFEQGYGGVATDGSGGTYPIIDSNTFRVTGRAVYDCGVGVVQNNDFSASVAIAVDVTVGPCAIINNMIEGSGVYGIQVQAGTPYISGNTFTRVAGFSAGAIYVYGAAGATIRNNKFMAQAGNIVVSSGGSSAVPDLGSEISPGNNQLGSAAAVGLDHRSSAAIQAYGNTWAHDPPVCGQDIKTTGASVTFGAGTSCP